MDAALARLDKGDEAALADLVRPGRAPVFDPDLAGRWRLLRKDRELTSSVAYKHLLALADRRAYLPPFPSQPGVLWALEEHQRLAKDKWRCTLVTEIAACLDEAEITEPALRRELAGYLAALDEAEAEYERVTYTEPQIERSVLAARGRQR